MSKKLAIAMFGQKRLSREGGVEIVVKELCTRMAQNGCDVTCYNRAGHHVSGAEYDDAGKTEYEGIRQKSVPTIERRGLAAVSSSAFAALYSAFGKYDVVHIHAEGPAFFAWLPKMFGKRVVVTVHGIDWQREKWQSGLGSKFIHQGEKNAAKYADEVIVLSKGVQDYFKETYGRETHFIPNGVNIYGMFYRFGLIGVPDDQRNVLERPVPEDPVVLSLQGSAGRNLYPGSIRLQKGSEESFGSG